jgi:hypothetical protein
VQSRNAWRSDLLVAGLLALLLGAAWTWADWSALARLHLPDTDDVVRLQQIRDWLAGQSFADVSQHRLAGGLAMHWSRLPDLAPAALIALLSPVVGAHMAELAAVIVWPTALFATALLLIARIARSLGVHAGTAAVVAAIAYPATTLFMPGRIDHHGLQMVLFLGATLALVRPAGAGTGVTAGLLAAASLVVGLETAPLFAGLGGLALAEWVVSRPGAAERVKGLGIGALVGLAAAKGIFATSAWDYPACDGLTATTWRAALAIAPVPLALGLLDRRLEGWRIRATVAILGASAAGAVALWLSPSCLSPYGEIGADMARLWLAEVGEAQGLFAAPPATALAYAGLMFVGIGCTTWQVRTTPDARWGWAVLLAGQLVALAVTITALRGAYAGALLAAPALAAAIAAERARGPLRLAGTWAASAGMLYPLAAQALTPERDAIAAAQGDCASPAMAAALNGLPTGTVMAPIDAGAYLLAATGQRVVAAPYHRNDAGNRAAYAFYLGGDAGAAGIASGWGVDYALACAAMPGIGRVTPMPGWRVLATLPDGAKIYSRGLSRAPAGR